MSVGSILGDEGLSGQIHTYAATAISVTDGAIVFVATEGDPPCSATYMYPLLPLVIPLTPPLMYTTLSSTS